MNSAMPLNCSDAKHLIHLDVGDDLRSDEEQQLAIHMGQCVDCRSYPWFPLDYGQLCKHCNSLVLSSCCLAIGLDSCRQFLIENH